MALATRYAVSTQVDSSAVEARLPAICGSATLATLVSSTSMKVASMTTPAITQGLMAGCSGAAISKTCGCMLLLDIDGGFHVHPGAQNIIAARNRIQDDLHR